MLKGTGQSHTRVVGVQIQCHEEYKMQNQDPLPQVFLYCSMQVIQIEHLKNILKKKTVIEPIKSNKMLVTLRISSLSSPISFPA